MESKKRRFLLIMLFVDLLCLLGVVVWFMTREQPAVPPPAADAPLAAKRKVPPPVKLTDAGKPEAKHDEPAKAPSRPAELAVVDLYQGGLGKRLTRPGSAGRIFFTADDLTFAIQRDYYQNAAVGVENRGHEPMSIVAELIGLNGGMLGGFVGPGSVEQPLVLPAGAKAVLALHLFAQDADRTCYQPRVEIKDAQNGEVQAWAPVNILVTLPAFKLAVKLGTPEPATLALPVTLTNQGGPITDLAVLPGKNLQGNVSFQPSVNHANLAVGGALSFTVQPRLHTGFAKLEGEVILRGGGQEQAVPVQLMLPEGKKVFVASSFSTGSMNAADWICTNRPNVDTPIGGFIGPPVDPFSSKNPYLPQGDVTWTWLRIGPIEFHTTFGKSPIGPFTPAGSASGGRVGKLPPLGLGNTADPQTGVDPQAATTTGQSTGVNAAGSQFRGGDASYATAGPTGTVLHGPRGLEVRPAYFHHRPLIFADNEPESMIAVSGGEPGKRVMLEAWHSQRWCGDKGRQILLRVWDGYGQRPLSQPIQLSDGTAFDQWPAVVVFPDLRALVVWETSVTANGPTSLVYRISEPGFGTWSPPVAVPGAQAKDKVAHFDPAPVLGPDGQITLVWQQGEGKSSRIMVTHSTKQGDFAPPVSPTGLPPGASRPIPRVGADGVLHLAFQAPVVDEGPDVHTAVFYGRSHDGGAKVENFKRLSGAKTDAGEVDLLVTNGGLRAAFRAGADWQSRIMHASSLDNGQTWTDAKAVTPTNLYAEYPSLDLHADNHVEIEFYGGNTGKPAGPTVLKRFAVDHQQETWSEPRRLLTHYPTVTAAWLQVNFRLRNSREQYQPHELSILLNGKQLLNQKKAVPEGTYLLPFDPSLLQVDDNGLPRNVVGLRTVHMNGGHYSSATEFRLQAKHAFFERLVVAKDQREADGLLAQETPSMNHGRPDVGLFAAPGKEGAPLTGTPKAGESVTVPLVVGNLGEKNAGTVRIGVYGEAPEDKARPKGQSLAKLVEIGDLKPLELRTVEITFPFTGKEHYYIFAQSDGDDFDPSNNVHVVSFAAPRQPTIQPLNSEPSAEFDIRLGDGAGAPYRLRLLESGTAREVATANGRLFSAKIPSGKYQLAMKRYEFEGKEVVFPREIVHQEGSKQRLALRTAIEIELPDEVPSPYRWEVVKADDPKEIVQWQSGSHRVMQVPPGKYRLALHPFEFSGARLVWPVVFEVMEDQHVVVKLASLVMLEMPKEAGPLYTWEVIKAGQPKEVVQWQYGGQRVIVVPPGKYQIVTRPFELSGQRLVWPQEVEVKEDQRAVVRVSSFVKLEMPNETGPLYTWEVMQAGQPEKALQWQYGGDRVMLVPPGRYQVAITPFQFSGKRLVWPKEIDVKADEHAVVKIASTIKLEMPKEAGPLYTWEVMQAGQPEKALQWQYGGDRVMLVPPGKYQIAISPFQFSGKRLVWPKEIDVKADEHAVVKIASAIKLEMPKEAGSLYMWEVIQAGKPKEVVQWHYGADRVLAVPTGKYQIVIKPFQFSGERLVWPKEIDVKDDKQVAMPVNSGVKLDVAKGAGTFSRWEVAESAKPDKVFQWQSGDQPTMTLPPGEYQATILPSEFTSKRLLWPHKFQVKEADFAVLKFDSGIRVVGPLNAKPEFAMQIIDLAKKTTIQECRQTWAVQVIPPGTYRVEIRANDNQPWQVIAERIQVDAGRVSEVQLPAMPAKK